MRKRIRGGLIASLIVLALLAVGADIWLATSKGPVFCPPNARWLVAIGDFPGAYKKFLRSNLAGILYEELPQYRADWQLAVRQDTGIRPTPARWRVWLGRRFLGAVTQDGPGACVRPGILVRGADAVRGLGRGRPSIRRFGPYYYGWRQGALVFSRSEQYVIDSLAAKPFMPMPSEDDNEIWVYEQEARSALRLVPGKNSFEGWFGAFSRQPDPLPPDWNLPPMEPAIAWVAGPDMQDLRVIGATAYGMLEHHTKLTDRPWFKLAAVLLAKGLKPWAFDMLPANWDDPVEGIQLALLDLDTSEPLPVPEVAAVFKAKGDAAGPHPLQPMAAAGPAMPYEWDGHPGTVAPRAGEKAALCLTRAGACWLAASQEPAMARLLREMDTSGKPFEGEPGRVAVVAVNFAKSAAKAEWLARQGAKLELTPGVNAADLEKNVMPLLRALGRLGRLQLDFYADGDRLRFTGSLRAGL